MKKLIFGFFCLFVLESKAQSDYFFIGSWTDNSIFLVDNEKGVTVETDIKTLTFSKDNTGYFTNKGEKNKHPFIWKYFSYSPHDLTIISDTGKTIKWSIKQLHEKEILVIATLDRKKSGLCDYYIVSTLTKTP